jgi:hypothetical protein
MTEDTVDAGLLGGLKLDARAMSRTLTGFDEIAIKQRYGAPWDSLDGMFAARALMFVQMRRDGSTDGQAYRASMEATIGQLNVLFGYTPDGDAPDEDAEGNEDGPTTTMTD